MDDVECGNGFENHSRGDGFLEWGVVYESLVPALVQLFAREVEPEGASVVDERDVEVLRQVFGFDSISTKRITATKGLRPKCRIAFGSRVTIVEAFSDDVVKALGDGVAVV